MAGNGNPYIYLTCQRLRILNALRDQPTLDDLATSVQLTREDLSAELQPLRDAHLITEAGGRLKPTFLIANRDETQRVDAHAARIGERIAECDLGQQSTIAAAFGQLAVSNTTTWDEISFLLIGDRILDVGLLDALAREGTLMPSAPARPSPDNPEARYYCWMIEGEHDHLGRYGQRTTKLPRDGWELITFGQYTIGDEPIAEREWLERVAPAFVEADSERTPTDVARHLRLPLIDCADAEYWWSFARGVADDLLSVYLNAQRDLDRLYASLGASDYLTDGFGEFFCWYDHLAYAHAIDALAAAGAVTIPERRFTGAVWQEVPQATSF